jgi:flavin reductase (DIM6/NTAB) family NADH-FMN oxidoreductase RutF
MQILQCPEPIQVETRPRMPWQAPRASGGQEGDIASKFKEAMRKLGSGAALITARRETRRFGMTATSLTPVSLSPASLLICVNESASIHAPIAASRRFCVNLLNRHQANLARRFAIKPHGEARFEHGVWSEDEDGLPILASCVANIACAVARIISHGTHGIIIGNVLRVSCPAEADPLLYLNGVFGKFTGV